MLEHFTENFLLYLTLAFVLIVLPLAVYTGMLWRKLHQQQRQQAAIFAQHQIAEHKQHKSLFESVEIIVDAMQQEQCDLSEGCWRISVLLQNHDEHKYQKQFPQIFALYQRIQHMAILDERKQLPKQQRMRQDFDRLKHEAELKTGIETELEQLKNFCQQQIEQLKATLAQ